MNHTIPAEYNTFTHTTRLKCAGANRKERTLLAFGKNKIQWITDCPPVCGGGHFKEGESMSELKPCPFCGESKLLYSGGCGFRYDDDDNQIRLFRVHCRTCKGRTGVFESLDEAVEAWNRRTNSTTIQPSALSTNLAEVGTDCISRQAAIDALERAKQNIQHNIERAIGRAICEILDEVENGIKQLPPIQPKRGKWIDVDVMGMPAQACDQCNTFFPLAYTGGGHHYCPNCGAKMEVNSESN